MEKVRIDAIEQPPTSSPADVVRPLSDALGTTDLAINQFELEPGDSIGYEYHRHLDQEEVFVVQQGTVTFETESGGVEVSAGEVIRFAPGEFQLGRNRSEGRATVLAFGAPRETEEIEYYRECPECGEETVQVPELDEGSERLRIRCTECEAVTSEIAL